MKNNNIIYKKTTYAINLCYINTKEDIFIMAMEPTWTNIICPKQYKDRATTGP